MFYEYYLHTEDVKFLKDVALEFFVETATFYEDLLKLNKTTKTFESLISYTENTPVNCLGKSESIHIASNAAADFVCANQIFSILTEIGKVAGLEEEDIKKWEDLSSKVPNYEVDDAGIIKEFNSNLFETNNNLPGVGHLFPYNVGSVAITARKDLEKLVATTAKTRLNNCRGEFTAQHLVGLATTLATTGVMLLLNMYITPLYFGMPRSSVVEMIPKILLPFNFAKALLNSSLALLLYKPIITALRRAGLVERGSHKTDFNKTTVLTLAIGGVSLIVAILIVVMI
jgi:hypothetical protein